jgi:lipid A ethanolaminephosphotransferase
LVAAICVYHLIAFQGPLIGYAVKIESTALQITSLQLMQLCLLAALLLMFGTVSVWLMKLLAILLILTNAAALYFMHSYQVQIDLTMITNILATNTGQASELWHWMLGAYMLVLGGIPAYFISKTNVRSPKRFLRALTSVVVFFGFIGWMFATAITWPWYDRHATRMGALILPWSYVVNTGRFYNKQLKDNRVQVLLPDATFLGEPTADKEIVVLVLGEAARAANFGILGYGRDTNPFTAETDLFALPVGRSCATYTIGAMACILTHEGREAGARTTFEPLPSYMTRHGVHTIWHSNSGGTPPFNADRIMRARELAAACTGADCPDGKLDGALFYRLDQLLTQTDAQRIFVVLHQTGSHGPRYFQKYPPELEVFTPVCRTVQMRNCSYEELVNAYDNTIHYTDYLLADLIAQLQGIPGANTAMMYVSDHGQSLGENGLYLHGTPPVVAPDVQREVPFLVWMSDGFKQARGIENADVMQAETFPHDFPFHSVMGAFGMRSDIYKPEFDIFSAATFD